MRILRTLGCALAISTAHATAHAQPAPASDAAPSVPPAAAAAVPEPAPESTLPLAPPGLAPVGPLPAPEPAFEVHNYRWQIAAVDAAGLALVLSHSETGVSLGALTYILGGPIVHGLHDQGGRMGVSLALRLGLPILLAYGGASLAQLNNRCSPDDDDCDSGALGGALLGFGLGVATAMVIDTAVIARPIEVRNPPGATWAPQIAVTSHRVGLGVIGRF
jgi:hypothetical protein